MANLAVWLTEEGNGNVQTGGPLTMLLAFMPYKPCRNVKSEGSWGNSLYGKWSSTVYYKSKIKVKTFSDCKGWPGITWSIPILFSILDIPKIYFMAFQIPNHTSRMVMFNSVWPLSFITLIKAIPSVCTVIVTLRAPLLPLLHIHWLSSFLSCSAFSICVCCVWLCFACSLLYVLYSSTLQQPFAYWIFIPTLYQAVCMHRYIIFSPIHCCI